METFSADKQVKLLRTYSGFRGMDDDLREWINKDVCAAIQNAGGNIHHPYRALLFRTGKAAHE